MNPSYKLVHNSPILMAHPFPKPGMGLRSGSVILVDRGDEYVVAKQYNDEETGESDREWAHGSYFSYNTGGGLVRTTQADALMEAVMAFKAAVEKL